jgi:hypothetical protein
MVQLLIEHMKVFVNKKTCEQTNRVWHAAQRQNLPQRHAKRPHVRLLGKHTATNKDVSWLFR